MFKVDARCNEEMHKMLVFRLLKTFEGCENSDFSKRNDIFEEMLQANSRQHIRIYNCYYEGLQNIKIIWF